MHLGLLRKFTPYFVNAILFDTFVVGLVAGYYREKSGSLRCADCCPWGGMLMDAHEHTPPGHSPRTP